MKKTLLITLLLLITGLTGCIQVVDGSAGNGTTSVSTSVEDALMPTQKNINSYELDGNISFVPVSYQYVKDGTTNGLDIVQYVDLSTGVTYVYLEKYKSGYGITMEMLVDEDGNPLIYKDLDQLRSKYNWVEE